MGGAIRPGRQPIRDVPVTRPRRNAALVSHCPLLHPWLAKQLRRAVGYLGRREPGPVEAAATRNMLGLRPLWRLNAALKPKASA
ncbi:hypothetical protein SGLAM104S_04144 [Streptomyces glaucescens]